jgi:P27 family predicted phage terminase small subunit
MPGPPRKPRALKLIEGTDRKDRGAANPVSYTEGIPPCPDHLGPDGRAEWKRITAELSKVPGLLQRVDRATLAAYCSAVALFEHCDKLIQERGLTYVGGNLERVRPECKIRNEAFQQMRAMAAEFGFTPASRSRVSIPPAKGDSETDMLAKKYLA